MEMGFIGEHPSLTDLERNRDLKFTTDFRSLYTTVLSEWLCADQSVTQSALFGYTGGGLDLGFACSSEVLSVTSNDEETFLPYKIYIVHQDGKTFLNIDTSIDQDVKVDVFDMSGKYIGQLINQYLTKGSYSVNVKLKLKNNITNGYYIYSAKVQNGVSNKKMLVL